VLWRLERSPGYLEAAREIIRREGYGGLFAGLKPTIVGIVPYAGTSFVTFHSLKDRAVAWTDAKGDADLPTHIRLACGAVAGLAAQTATYPLDIVRRRMQVMGMEGAPCPSYSSMLDAATTIIRTEGPSVLFKGLSMNFVKGPIAVATSFTVNDRLKQALAPG
jgi:solute carrier family 25 protein 42